MDKPFPYRMLGNILTILIPIFVTCSFTIFIWGKKIETIQKEHSMQLKQVELTEIDEKVKLDHINKIETTLTEHSVRLKQVEAEEVDIQDKLAHITADLRGILISLENKVDEKK